MRIITAIASFLLISCAHAEAPFTYTTESSASDITGKVVMESEKGWRYVGAIKNGKPHGNGIKILSDGMVIYGEWVEGEQQGPGAIYKPEPFDSVTAGNYQDGKIQGEGVILIKGEKFEGPFGRLGTPDGNGHCIDKEKRIPCTYDNGIKKR